LNESGTSPLRQFLTNSLKHVWKGETILRTVPPNTAVFLQRL